MSNIYTDFIRVCAWPDGRIDEVEAQWIAWMLLGRNGSSWVPVFVRRDLQGRHVDVQYGSGKSPDIATFCGEYVGSYYGAIWGRRYDEGGSQDVIWQDDVNDGPRRFCRYGFDEVRVFTADGRAPEIAEVSWQRHPDGAWHVRLTGSYRTGNDRSTGVGPCATPATDVPEPDPAELPLPTLTTPATSGDELTGIDPPWLAALTIGASTATSIAYRWRGRSVHLASFQIMDRYYETSPTWHHRGADDWDNCLDPEFLRFTGATDLLAPAEVYERDQQDWEADTWYRR